MALNDNLRGALFMSLSMVAFVTNDMLMKTVSDQMPLVQVIAIRGIFATSFVIAMALAMGAFRKAREVGITVKDKGLIGARVLSEIGATFCFLTALFNMPFANATAILQAGPLAITMAAAIFLREQVGWRRWAATLTGFFGVLLIVRPGPDGFNTYALLAIASVGFMVVRDLSTTRLSKGVPSVFVSVFTACGITLAAAGASLFVTWAPLATETLLVLIGSSIFLVFGYLFGVMAMRQGEIGFVSPFRYTIMIWAFLYGILIFGEIPHALEIVGISIVIAAGLYTFHRERVRGRA